MQHEGSRVHLNQRMKLNIHFSHFLLLIHRSLSEVLKHHSLQGVSTCLGLIMHIVSQRQELLYGSIDQWFANADSTLNDYAFSVLSRERLDCFNLLL
jgi:hypothetical protein